MRMTKRVAALLAGPVAALAAMVPATPAHATPGASICTIFTSLHFDNGIPLNPTETESGTYYFWGASAICAGTVTGYAAITSTGTYTAGQALPSFTGTFSTTAFTVGGSCSGTIGGFLGNRVGTVITATLNLRCGNVAGGTTSATAAMALNFVPNPLTLNTCNGYGTNSYICDGMFSEGVAVLAGT
jgi:hypothetical protein